CAQRGDSWLEGDEQRRSQSCEWTAYGGGGGDIAVAADRINEHAAGGKDFAVVRHIDVAAGIHRDTDWVEQPSAAPVDGGDWGLVERPGAASHGRVDKHAGGADVRHVDVAAGIQRDTGWVAQGGVAPGDGGDWTNVAVGPRRIDIHALGAIASFVTVVRYINVAAGIHRDAVGGVQAGVGPADAEGGGSIAVTPRRIDIHARRDGVPIADVAVVHHIDVAAGIQRDAVRVVQAGAVTADGGAGGGIAVAPRRIDHHAGGAAFAVTGRAVGRIDFAAGIQCDAFRGAEGGGDSR